MSLEGLKKVGWFFLLVILQVLVLNKVNLWGYATPFLYIYLVLKMGVAVPRYQILLTGFVLGLVIDCFTNTLGVNASATVLLAFCQPVFLKTYAPRDADETLVPSVSQMGIWPFVKFVLLCVTVHHTVLLLLEYFTFAGFLHTLLKIVGSVALTVCLVLAVEKITD